MHSSASWDRASWGGSSDLSIPAFTGFTAAAGTSKVATSGFLFPALFITIACGAHIGLP
ncbi:MAG TPA: hypothetical protein OIM11_07465 [Coriobacteriaceae bacterium]|nr:hypothetical protein [Coriobacteriaceae bacterium]